MHFNRFQQGDSVMYVGKKDTLRSTLASREGVVTSRVQGEERLLCVSYGDNAYLLDEFSDLARFIKREKVDHTDHKKGPDVQKRRGVSGDDSARKGGKRRKGQQDEEA